ncbi:DUF84 family protein [Candidatus Woesearchaeota archaeon]|nr:DUF84 family protein [Candidatus Woesearchaeota archaeon]
MTPKIIITVGSLAPPKIAAVEKALERYALKCSFLKDREVREIEVKTTVPAQPMNRSDTIEGAKQRARAALKDSTWGVGIESGFSAVPESKVGYLECSVCAIYDGEEYFLGFSPAFECPPEIMTFLLKGYNLSEAMKHAGLTTQEYVGYAEGAVGILSQGVLTRKDYLQVAVEMALMGAVRKIKRE